MIFVVVVAVLLLAAVWWRGKGLRGLRPPGTAHLDEETAERPELDPAAVAAARARISQQVPDEVLSDVLLDASPTQAARMFSAVPAAVMADALGYGQDEPQPRASAAELAQLRGAGNAVDDLEIFNFIPDDFSAGEGSAR
ncbi:hypothetical protein QR90_14135 [Deinococcus radiopugnans]|uniref:Uncharacterized protein n=2 Tax=Deinococcus radiopugnans TaxID=57497 RepID=A0A0A7KIQ4_9DEIO|nr:hypothetical protein QR90_14135 [Deinococcus radiopugnans]QLG11821.1 hypothetical protein HLB42_14275 [Deinococcus sp. D7000]TNM67830.1 hypothetical protein FHR04_17800 [Deinococcus radiopugnans ATCC 19172]